MAAPTTSGQLATRSSKPPVSIDVSSDNSRDAHQLIRTPPSPSFLPLAAIPTRHVHAEPEQPAHAPASSNVATRGKRISKKRPRAYIATVGEARSVDARKNAP